MLIEPESAPSSKVKGHDYSKTKAASPNLPLTEKMYWSIWKRYNEVIDSVIANPLTATIFTGSSLLKDLEVIQKTNITTGDFSKTHTLMVNWHTAAIRILPAGQTVAERKKLKIQMDEMLVLTNLMNDMGGAATKQSEKKTVKDTTMMVFFIGNSSEEAEAMVTVDRSDPSVPYIANFWGAPGSGAGKELLKALPSELKVTTFRLHALNQDIADLYTKNYKGRPK
ncbi:MAG TPA: hypothetical protein VL832_30285 [Puia sp.]|nr:hypothetical protein [Puia sp.]